MEALKLKRVMSKCPVCKRNIPVDENSKLHFHYIKKRNQYPRIECEGIGRFVRKEKDNNEKVYI